MELLFGWWVELGDERPGFGGPALLFVVAFDVADAVERRDCTSKQKRLS